MNFVLSCEKIFLQPEFEDSRKTAHCFMAARRFAPVSSFPSFGGTLLKILRAGRFASAPRNLHIGFISSGSLVRSSDKDCIGGSKMKSDQSAVKGLISGRFIFEILRKMVSRFAPKSLQTNCRRSCRKVFKLICGKQENWNEL